MLLYLEAFDHNNFHIDKKIKRECFPFPGSVFTNDSQEHSLSYSPRFSKVECNTTSDWLNQTV